MFSYVKWLQSYKVAKLEIKKRLGQFGFEATFFATLCSKSLLSERPGFDSRRAQTLKACIFEVLLPFLSYNSFLEISKYFLYRLLKKSGFAAF